MEKKKKLKINVDLLRQLREAELSNVVGGITHCGGNTAAICCTSAGVLTACVSISDTTCCQP